MPENPIATANRVVRIAAVCRHIAGIRVPDYQDGRTPKLHCPFGEFSHVDGGKEAALRIYPGPNNAWCFACQQFWTPVSLAAAIWDVTWEQAATELLEQAGWKPADYGRAWEQAIRPEPVDVIAVGEALKVWCEAIIPDWKTRQLDPVAAQWLSKCLGLLAAVSDEGEARLWLEGCQHVMAEAMGASL